MSYSICYTIFNKVKGVNVVKYSAIKQVILKLRENKFYREKGMWQFQKISSFGDTHFMQSVDPWEMAHRVENLDLIIAKMTDAAVNQIRIASTPPLTFDDGDLRKIAYALECRFGLSDDTAETIYDYLQKKTGRDYRL